MANEAAHDPSVPPAPAPSATPQPQPPPESARQADQVSAALALGHQMTQLYIAVEERYALPGGPPRHYRTHVHPPPPIAAAGLGPLDDDGLFELRLFAVQAALHRIRGVASDAGLVMPTAEKLIAAGTHLYGDRGLLEVSQLHAQLIQVLGASLPVVGAAYELGSALAALCEATCRDASEFEAAINAGRIDRIEVLLDRLQSVLPPHSARAVRGALGNWEEWLAAGKIGGQPIDWDKHGPQIAQALNHQGTQWFSLLTGQKATVDLLSIDSYVSAGEGMVRQYRHLGGRFLAQFWPWLIVGAVVGAVLVFLFWHYGKGDTKGFGTIATLLATVGITAKTATSTISRTATDVGNSLWQAELDGAITLAATSLPAGDVPVGGVVFRPLQFLQRRKATLARDARHDAMTARSAAGVAAALAMPRSVAAPPPAAPSPSAPPPRATPPGAPEG